MKIVKTYEKFSEEYRLNENLFKKAWGAISAYFRRHFGKHAWIYYALYLLKHNQLPEEFDLICPPGYLSVKDLPSDDEIKSNIQRIVMKDDNEEDKKLVEESLNEASIHHDDEPWIRLESPDPNMRDVDVDGLIEKIELIYNINALRASRHGKDNYDPKSKFVRKRNHAVFIWGAPGIGKTEILHQVADKLDVAVLEWHLATIEPTDFRGVPEIDMMPGGKGTEDERTYSRLPSLFPTSDGENGKGGIMFFDELNRAPEMVLSASLSLALSGKHGEYSLPPRWIVIAAGNRPEDIQGRLVDDPILWNRFGHINYVPKIEDWIRYAKNQEHFNPDLFEFFEKYGTYYHQLSPDSAGAPNWPSPRTWEMASEEEYFERGENWKNWIPYTEMMEIYEDLVGYNAAKKFIDFVKEQDEKRRKEKEAKRKLSKKLPVDKIENEEEEEEDIENNKPGRGRLYDKKDKDATKEKKPKKGKNIEEDEEDNL